MELRRIWTETAAGRMHARVGGHGSHHQPVILVHGLIISSRCVVPTGMELAPLCPVYAVDLPGYGDSVKPPSILGLAGLADALATWMDAMQFPSAHLVANSFGCQVLAEFALRHADRVNRLVFQGPTVDPNARSVRQQLARLIRNSATEAPGLGWITIIDYGGDAENPRHSAIFGCVIVRDIGRENEILFPGPTAPTGRAVLTERQQVRSHAASGEGSADRLEC